MNVSRIWLKGEKALKQQAREQIAETEYRLSELIQQNLHLINNLEQVSLRALDRKVKHGKNLTFEEAFCGMCYVLVATNNHVYRALNKRIGKSYGRVFDKENALTCGTAFLQLMAVKESLKGVTAEEIAGMVAATFLDTVVKLDLGEITETCGMGGDVGFSRNGITKKTINCSTLSALVLSATGTPTVKHGSYSNTSAMGSTEAIELFGARTNQKTVREVKRVWNKSGFEYLDAHWCKTVHDLSHLLMMETVNHIIGPMTPPISHTTVINKVMGVNEKVHPEVIAQAYAILHQKGCQNVGGVVVVSGLDCNPDLIPPHDHVRIKRHAVLDELSPHGAVVSCAYGSSFLGTYTVKPSDFGVTMNADQIVVENTKEAIQRSNIAALSGSDEHLANYLAMNAALGRFAVHHLRDGSGIAGHMLVRHVLRDCFDVCRGVISSGKALETLKNYVEASGGKFKLPQ